jgi:hypothetical protein
VAVHYQKQANTLNNDKGPFDRFAFDTAVDLADLAHTRRYRIPSTAHVLHSAPPQQLVVTRPDRDMIVYKMHGDVDHRSDAVLSKDDYERYPIKMRQFVESLRGDLISKTFMFLGFSFSDPNIDYSLKSRTRPA